MWRRWARRSEIVQFRPKLSIRKQGLGYTLAGLLLAPGRDALPLTCPNCGNTENFLVKTLQMHLLRVTDGQVQPPQEEGRPALVEILCDECDSTLDLNTLEESARRDLLVTLGAR